MRITILDYGAGNLHSLEKALAADGATVRISGEVDQCLGSDVLVLPGVGSFAYAVARIAPLRAALRDAIIDGLPTIGICLGMQLLFAGSDEGPGDGLAVIDGRVTRLDARRVPHIGWNAIDNSADAVVAQSGLHTAYYANSFVCRPRDVRVVSAWSRHEGDRFPAVVRAYRTMGVQFHPEKSSAPGVRFLRTAVQELVA